MSEDFGQGPVDFRRVDITAFVKRLVRYYETQGNGDWRYAAEIIEQQNTEIERLRARVSELEAAQEWRPIESAPRDGAAFLAFGRHTHSPADAQRGVVAGDFWWAIILWDKWRDPHQWVFAKDGAKTWSAPEWWLPLLAPPKVAK